MINWSLDSITGAIAKYRGWLYLATFALCIASHFHWLYVLAYGVMFIVETCIGVNEKYTLPPSPLPELGKSDVALVTGGSAGFGLELVKSLVFSHGVGRVIIIDRTEPAFAFDARVQYVACDLADREATDACVDRVMASLDAAGQRVTVLISNAGIRDSGSLVQMDLEALRRVFEVNTLSHAALMKKVLAHYTASKCTGRLSVVTVGSVLGSFGPRNLSAYSASKAALFQVHECVQQEVQELPAVRMLMVVPGQLTTGMFHDVTPTRLFLAPLVNHTSLARAVLVKVNRGESGVLCSPFYANWLPAMKVLPSFLQQWARTLSEMDQKIAAEPSRRLQ